MNHEFKEQLNNLDRLFHNESTFDQQILLFSAVAWQKWETVHHDLESTPELTQQQKQVVELIFALDSLFDRIDVIIDKILAELHMYSKVVISAEEKCESIYQMVRLLKEVQIRILTFINTTLKSESDFEEFSKQSDTFAQHCLKEEWPLIQPFIGIPPVFSAFGNAIVDMIQSGSKKSISEFSWLLDQGINFYRNITFSYAVYKISQLYPVIYSLYLPHFTLKEYKIDNYHEVLTVKKFAIRDEGVSNFIKQLFIERFTANEKQLFNFDFIDHDYNWLEEKNGLAVYIHLLDEKGFFRVLKSEHRKQRLTLYREFIEKRYHTDVKRQVQDTYYKTIDIEKYRKNFSWLLAN